MEQRKILRAEEGMVLTDGNVYGTIIYLAEGRDGSDFTTITKEEYEARMASPEAEEEDYRAALKNLGVKV